MGAGEDWSLADLIPADELREWELRLMKRHLLDVRSLPLKVERRGTPGFGAGTAVGLGVLASPWLALLVYSLVREYPDAKGPVVYVAALFYGLLSAVILLPVLFHLVRRESITISRDRVSYRLRGLLGTTKWEQPLADFRGLLVHYQRNASRSSGTFFFLSLVADGGRRLDVFRCVRGNHALRVGEAFAEALALPLLAGNLVPASFFDSDEPPPRIIAGHVSAHPVADCSGTKPRPRFRTWPGLWSVSATARFPGPVNVYSRDLNSFLADAAAVATGREMAGIEQTERSIIVRADSLAGEMALELQNDKDGTVMRLNARLSTMPIGWIFFSACAAILAPLLIVVPPFSTVNDVLRSQFGSVGSLTVVAGLVTALYGFACSQLRRPKLARCKRAFQQITDAFAGFQKAYAQMPADRRDKADYQPEYARLLPEGGTGFSLAPLRYCLTLSWPVELQRPETVPFLRGVMADARFQNTHLETKEMSRADATRREAEMRDRRWDYRRPPCARHYVAGTSRGKLPADTITVLLTPRGDHTHMDTWSAVPSYISPVLVLSWLGLVTLAMTVHGYAFVIAHGHNPILGYFFAVALGLGFLGAYPLLRRWHTIRKNRAGIVESLGTLKSILSVGNLRRVHEKVLPRLAQWTTKYSGVVVGIRDDSLCVHLELDSADTASRVIAALKHTSPTGAQHVDRSGRAIALFPPLCRDSWMTPDVFMDIVEESLAGVLQKGRKTELPG